VEAFTGLARLRSEEGRDSALAILVEARRRAGLLSDPQQRRRSQADLETIEGTLILQEDPRRSVDLLASALPVYEENQSRFLSLWAFLARGRAYRALGDATRAEQDFEQALEIYQGMGKKLDQEGFRLALLEETDTVFDELVSLQAARDPDRAFASADRARSRVLPGSDARFWSGASKELSRLRAEEPRPLSQQEIARRLPAGTTLVQFSVLADRVLIWRLRRNGGGRRFFVANVSRKDLEALVAKLQRFRQPGWNEASASLFNLLVRPWLDAAPSGERIVLVPDKALHRVPFTALRDGVDGGFLIERNPLAVAPSATLYVNALARQRKSKRTARGPGLVIGEPAFDHSLFSSLSSLPESASEAMRLAKQTRSTLLVGKDAVKSKFLTQAPRSEWIHFSGHSLVDPRNTLLSKLVLAPEGEGDPGVLTAQEIYSLDLDSTGLVVLAACETGNQYIPGSEGVTSLARAFLAARVPTVVASLWSVDDQATADLFDGFYQFLLGGDDPVDALRKAQLGMLRGGNLADRPPQAWAAFEVIGASAE
jgi:CHAT domain-containing protein